MNINPGGSGIDPQQAMNDHDPCVVMHRIIPGFEVAMKDEVPS